VALGGFALLLVAVILLNQREAELPELDVTPSPEPLWMVASEEILSIRVEDLLAQEMLEVQRDEQLLWKIVLPEPSEADAARVERAASWLANPAPRSEIAMQVDLSIFGLTEPEYRVTVYLQGGDSLGFDVGRSSPTGGSRYVLYPGREAILLMREFGLDEVLDLITDLAPTPTPTPTEQVTDTPAPQSTEEN
jgi:hypothetical protein